MKRRLVFSAFAFLDKNQMCLADCLGTGRTVSVCVCMCVWGVRGCLGVCEAAVAMTEANLVLMPHVITLINFPLEYSA